MFLTKRYTIFRFGPLAKFSELFIFIVHPTYVWLASNTLWDISILSLQYWGCDIELIRIPCFAFVAKKLAMNIFSSRVYWSTGVGFFLCTWQVGHEISVWCWCVFCNSLTTFWWTKAIRLPHRWFRSFLFLFKVPLAFVLNCLTKF